MRIFAVFGIIVGLTLAVVAWLVFDTDDGPRHLRIASGSPGGTYHRLAHSIARIANDEAPHLRIDVLQTAGSVENSDLLSRGEAEVGLLQNDGPGGPELAAIAPLYSEILHIFATSPRLQEMSELAGLKVAGGAPDSGTARLTRRLLTHFGLADKVTVVDIGGIAAVKALEAGEVDAACLVSGLGSMMTNRAFQIPGAHLVGVDDRFDEGSAVAGFCLTHPYVEPFIIPRRTYGDNPVNAVPTLSVSAVLVVQRDLPEEVVRGFTELVYTHRAALIAEDANLMHLSEGFDISRLQFALHPGARSWLERRDPGFLVQYAEAMGFVLSVLVTIGAFLAAAHDQIKRMKKNRIDVYYMRVNEILQALGEAGQGREQLDAFRNELQSMERRAFDELVNERLLADESFTIFQTIMGQCLEQIERLRLARGPIDPEEG